MLGILLIGSVYAQDRRISGQVISAEDGAPISGVSVMVVGSSIVTSTNENGAYSISVPSTATTLEFRFIGFVTRTITIGVGNIFDVTLTPDATSLDEVVVTGYSNVRKDQFAGSAAVLTADAVEDRPVGSFTQALQGRVPGMLVNSGSGQPGANPAIRIRGVKSIQGAGAQPLYVIDGVPTSESDFQSMNPNDFETITVLKDANSAALYGARGGTGVVVITTKKGTAGVTNITAKAQMGYTLAPDFSRMNLMNTEELLAYEEWSGLITGASSGAYGVPGWVYSRNNPANAGLSESELQRYDRLLDSTRNINTDIRDLLFRTGLSQMYELSARGGSERTRFFISGGVFKQEGIDLTSSLDRFTGRVNLDHTSNNLNIQWNTLASYSKMVAAVGDLYGNSPINPFQMIYRAKPYDNPYLSDGTLNYGGGGSNLNLKQLANVLERGQSTMDPRKLMKINTGLTLSYNILDNLKIKNIFGVDASNIIRETYIDPGSYSGSTQTYQSGYARENSFVYSQLVNTSSITYSDTFKDLHSFSLGAYFEAIRVYQKGLGFTLYNLNPGLPWTGQGASPLPTEGAATMDQNASSARSGYGIRSYFANATYSYDERITVNANIRRDGTSRIVNPENKEITTWSAGAVWNIHKERFMNGQNFFTELNLRASYGVIPNIGSIPTTTYGIHGTSVTNYAGSQVPAFGTTSYSGAEIPGLLPTAPGNPNLKIERIQKANVGIDFAAWRDRARFTFEFYNERTIDLFVRQPLSATTAFSNLDINAGIMNNKGIEGLVNVDVIRANNFRMTLGVNHAININRIVDLGLVNEYVLGTFLIKEGLPYGSHYTYHYLGADPETGRPVYRMEDGSTVNDAASADQFSDFGTFIPKHVGGFDLDFQYKGINVNALFSYQFDVVRSNNVRNWITRGTTGYSSAVNQSRELLGNQWEQPGDQAFYQAPMYDRGFTSSDLENAKFLRFRALNVGYKLPAIAFKNGKSAIKGANIYANFHNLAIWSPWRGVDPEDDNNISLVEYPNPRMIVFGIDITL